MFPWKTLASHGLLHMYVQQTISPEKGVFKRVECLSLPVNHGGISKNKDWSYGVVCFFFSPRVLAIALSCFSISSLWSARAILRESGVCCQNSPTCVTCTQVYLKGFHWLAMSPWSDRVILSLSVHAPLSVLLQPHRPPYSSSRLSRLSV